MAKPDSTARPDQLTVLTTLGVNAVKTYRLEDDETVVEGYGQAKHFTHNVINVDPRGLWLEKRRSEYESFVILGAPKNWKKGEKKRRLSSDRDGAEATIIDVPRLWMPIDVDQIDIDFADICGIDDGDTFARQLLRRLGIQGTWCVWHLTNSHGFFGRYRARLWMELATPATAAGMKAYAKERWGDDKVEIDGKMKRIVDLSVYQCQQPIYTGDPILLGGIEDPVTRRVGFIDGKPLDVGTLPRSAKSKKGAPEDENIAALIRAGLYIERYKPGQHMIDCPWEDGHTPGDRPDDTFYFEPHHNGHDIPAFKCHHASCEGKRWSDVAEFIGISAEKNGDERHDWGNAQRLWQHAKGDTRYEPVQRVFYVWDGTRWRMDDGAHRVQRLAVESTKRLLDEAEACADSSRRKHLLDWIRASLNEGRIKGAVELLKNVTECHVQAVQLDTDPFLVGVQNGTVDLRTGELRTPDRADLITKAAGCVFDPQAECPRWNTFLSQIMDGDESMIAYLQMLVGYTLSGDTSGQMLMFLYGTGQNGKSVLIEIVRDLLGEYGMSLRTEALSLKSFSSKNGPSEDIARLIGARMVTVNETAEGMRFDESLVKDLTGEDTVAARRMYQGTVEYRPAFKIWIRGNHQPEFNGADGGMARRIRLIPFDVRIPDEQVDPQLKVKLKAELPGILNWAIEGCRRWLSDGKIETPQKVIDATSEYIEDMDGLAEFINSELIRDKASRTPTAEIFNSYESWCHMSGIKFPMTKHKLGLRLKGRGLKAISFRVAGKPVRGFIGVRLKGAFQRVESDSEDLI